MKSDEVCTRCLISRIDAAQFRSQFDAVADHTPVFSLEKAHVWLQCANCAVTSGTGRSDAAQGAGAVPPHPRLGTRLTVLASLTAQDCEILDLDPEHGRPEKLILTHLLVPPGACLRPVPPR